MKGLASEALVVGFIALVVLGAGCQQGEVPGEQKSRLIAAENIQLKKDIARRDQEIEALKVQHDKEMAKQQEQLTKCLERKEALEKRLQQNIKEQVDSVLAVVVDENAKLREEIRELKAQIKQLQEQTEVKAGPADTP